MFKAYLLPVITGLYAVLVYSLLLFALFRAIDLIYRWLPWAAIIGVIFGLMFSLLLSPDAIG
jgi:hypothetical protein